MAKKAWFNSEEKLVIICHHCEVHNTVGLDITDDCFDAYKCHGCKKTFYAKAVLRFIVRKINEDLFGNDAG